MCRSSFPSCLFHQSWLVKTYWNYTIILYSHHSADVTILRKRRGAITPTLIADISECRWRMDIIWYHSAKQDLSVVILPRMISVYPCFIYIYKYTVYKIPRHMQHVYKVYYICQVFCTIFSISFQIADITPNSSLGEEPLKWFAGWIVHQHEVPLNHL